MNGKTVLVTGARGAMGSFMCEALAARFKGCRVAPFGREQLGSVAAAVEAMAPFPPIDYVFHFASDANVRRSFDRPLLTLSNNIGCTVTLLEALRETGQRPRVVLASTPEVYGTVTSPAEGFLESSALRPANPYAASKVAQESILHAYAQSYAFEYVITRAGSYVNPRRLDLALSAFALQIAEAEQKGDLLVLRHGNLDTVRPWCDARDMIGAYLLAATKGQSGETYNIGAGPHRAKRLGDVLADLLQFARVPVELKLDPALLRPTDVGFSALNVDKFARATGWRAVTPLESSLDWLMGSMRKEASR